jgi:hypothetical protein
VAGEACVLCARESFLEIVRHQYPSKSPLRHINKVLDVLAINTAKTDGKKFRRQLRLHGEPRQTLKNSDVQSFVSI